MTPPAAVPSPVVRRARAAFLMTVFLDDLAASVRAAQVARYRESDGSDTDEFEVVS